MEARQAVVIVSHGSRNPKANRQFNALVENVKEKKQDIRIEAAFFSLASPDLATAIKNIAQEGFTEILIVPFFLMHGNHVARDIPDLIEEQKKKYPHVSFTLGSTLCPAESLESLVINRVQELVK